MVDDTTAAGAPFSDRELILFVTFGFIAVTLIGQELLLPRVFRCSDWHNTPPTNINASTRPSWPRGREALNVAHGRLKQFAADGRISSEALAILRARHGRHDCRMMCGTSKVGWRRPNGGLGSDAEVEIASSVRQR